MKDLNEIKCIAITKTGIYFNATLYSFPEITTEDKIEQLQAQGIYGITGIIEEDFQEG